VYVSFVCRYVVPPGECYYNAVLYNAACMHAVSLTCAKNIYQNKSLGIIIIPYATFVPNLVSFVAELAHGEKSCTQSLTQPAYLMPSEPKLALWYMHVLRHTTQLLFFVIHWETM